MNRFREPVEPVTAHDEHFTHATVRELGAHPGPKRCALTGLDQVPEDVFDPVHVYTYGDMGGLYMHVCAVTDVHLDRVQVDHRVQGLSWVLLPGQYVVSYLVSDR